MPDYPPPLPVGTLEFGNITKTETDYVSAIEAHALGHERSQQTRIGPSEIGTPCARKIGYKLLGYPEPRKVNWKAQIGTWGHAGLEQAFQDDNMRGIPTLGSERWLTENRVSAGPVPFLGYELTGSCDLYDRQTGTVIDHKFVGPTQLKAYKSNGPGPQYRVQAHTYGYGWEQAGYPVLHVAISFLARQGELHDRFFWHEPYDQQVAVDALSRLSGIAQATSVLGTGALPMLETAEVYCHSCPFYKPLANGQEHGDEILENGCPGHPGAKASTPQTPPLQLI